LRRWRWSRHDVIGRFVIVESSDVIETAHESIATESLITDWKIPRSAHGGDVSRGNRAESIAESGIEGHKLNYSTIAAR
jgi:hypothetical protein